MTEQDHAPVPAMPPGCASMVDGLQLVLDGEFPFSAIECDSHLATCLHCRERLAAARLILGASMGTPPPSPRLTNYILAAVEDDQRNRLRHRRFAIASGAMFAIAASVLLATWLLYREPNPEGAPTIGATTTAANALPIAPQPRPAPLGMNLARVGELLRETSTPITAPVLPTDDLVDLLNASVTLPTAPSAGFAQTREALSVLPNVARAGLEPVTSTTQRAFARLFSDIGSVQVRISPKS